MGKYVLTSQHYSENSLLYAKSYGLNKKFGKKINHEILKNMLKTEESC